MPHFRRRTNQLHTSTWPKLRAVSRSLGALCLRSSQRRNDHSTGHQIARHALAGGRCQVASCELPGLSCPVGGVTDPFPRFNEGKNCKPTRENLGSNSSPSLKSTWSTNKWTSFASTSKQAQQYACPDCCLRLPRAGCRPFHRHRRQRRSLCHLRRRVHLARNRPTWAARPTSASMSSETFFS